MKETKSYLKNRWETELKSTGELVTTELQNKGNLVKLNLPRTSTGMIDLRGYSAPKKSITEKTNSGRHRTYVHEGIRIKKMRFNNVDLSYSDFESCEFLNCDFYDVKLDEARLVTTNYWGCKFKNLVFDKTNFGHSSFHAGGPLFKKILDNFTNVAFKEANLSEVNFNDQRFHSCQFVNCKTGSLAFSSCELRKLSFDGLTRDIFLRKSRQIENVDFSKAVLSGLNLENQDLRGLEFPNGDTYHLFNNKTKELANLNLGKSLSDEEKELVEVLKNIWSRNNLERDFVDVNWLKEEEMKTGKLVIQELKGTNNC